MIEDHGNRPTNQGIDPPGPLTSRTPLLSGAEEVAADRLEAEAWRRAVEGVERPVGWYQGKPGGYVKEYSDVLLIFLLKGLRPEKYRERMELKGGLARLDLRQLPDHLLERIANGEHILSVLASAVPLCEDGTIDGAKLLGARPAGGAGGTRER